MRSIRWCLCLICIVENAPTAKQVKNLLRKSVRVSIVDGRTITGQLQVCVNFIVPPGFLSSLASIDLYFFSSALIRSWISFWLALKNIFVQVCTWFLFYTLFPCFAKELIAYWFFIIDNFKDITRTLGRTIIPGKYISKIEYCPICA